MNFNFVKKEKLFNQMYKFCEDAENFVLTRPDLSVAAGRRALEYLVKAFYIAKYGWYPKDASLFELIQDNRFSYHLDDSVLSGVHLVRKLGNNGIHGEKVSKKEALIALESLFYTTVSVFEMLGLVDQLLIFDKDVYSEKDSQDVIPKFEEEILFFNEPELNKLKQNIDDNIVVSSNIDISEAETRKVYIDTALKDAGWEVHNIHNAIMAGKACVEIKLEGMPNNKGYGFADYILFDDDNMPLAVIEAKRTSVNPEAGLQQARLYAKAIEKKWGITPVIFTTNGFVINIVDGTGNPERRVYGFYSKDELHSLIIRRRLKKITNDRIDPMIADRYFIQEACSAVCEAFNNNRRKALLVMATGTGKTRCAISIVDVLQRYDWAKRVLFLADRKALVRQAENAFKNFLPNSSRTVILGEIPESERDYNARITISTYKSMLNLIDSDNKKYGVGHFDLIIIDECHRSIYNKYQAIFHYFDALLLGLTATPKEDVEKSTYDIFDLEKGKPTYWYGLDTAVKEGFLVSYRPFERTTNILKYGVKYSDLTKEQQEKYEELFADEEGTPPPQIPAKRFYKEIFNKETIDIMLNTLMEEGLRTNSGESLGKTIIFAANHAHAQKIVERFNKIYPEYGDDYCKLVDNYIEYAQTIIEEFSIKDSNPRIVVSVDMLDAGIDVPEILNLVFFKRIYSKIKFWQMIGRGTRTCKDLNVLSPPKEYFESDLDNDFKVENFKDKQGFYIFDFCGVFDFFRQNPDGKKAIESLTLTQKVFNLKLDMIFELQKFEHQSVDEHKNFYKRYKSEVLEEIKKLNKNKINVRYSLKYVDKYSNVENWGFLSPIELREIKKQITPLLVPINDEETAKLFDLWIFKMQLEEIIGNKDYSKAIQKVTDIAYALLDISNVLAIAKKRSFLEEIITNEFWYSISLSKLEKIRLELRDLIKFLSTPKKELKESNFDDFLIIKKGKSVPIPRFKNYKQRIIDYLSENYDSGAVYKIRNLEPLTAKDISELEKILWQDLGTKKEYEEVAGGKELAVFVRQIVGLEREAILRVYNEYLSKYNFNVKQQEFIHEIVNFVIQNGDIRLDNIINDDPFRHKSYDVLFAGKTSALYEFIGHFHGVIEVK